MREVKFLSRKEMKPLLKIMEEQWGADLSGFADDYVMFQRKNDINIISHDIVRFDFSPLRINSVGVYFGEYFKGVMRLSVEGSQIIGPLAKKNVLELDDEQRKLWMTGTDFEVDTDTSGFVIVKYKNDFMGTGRISHDRRLLCFFPKSRRLPADVF